MEPQRKQGYYVVCSYETGDAHLSSAFSSAALVAWLAKTVAPFGGGTGHFDVRQLGFLYLLTLFGAFALALWRRVGAVATVAIAWVVSDPGYLLFFNSLYADPALILAVVVVSLVLLTPDTPVRAPNWKKNSGVGLLVVAAAVGGLSKMQYALLPTITVAACLVPNWKAFFRESRRPWIGLALLLVLLIGAPAHFAWGNGPDFPHANKFNATLGGIARVSSDSSKALTTLGVPHELIELSPIGFYSAGLSPSDPLVKSVQEVSRFRLAWLYMTDPGSMVRAANLVEHELRKNRSHPRGVRTRAESGKRPASFKGPVDFSQVRAWLLRPLPHGAIWLLPIVATVLLAVRAARRQWDTTDAACLFLLLWGLSQIPLVILGDGFVSLHQHLLGARLTFDLLAVLFGCRVVYIALRVWRVVPN